VANIYEFELLVDIVYQILEAIEYINSQNYIHRDIKQDNIVMKAYHGRIIPKLIDFG
jgi:serine/threonine protein kinase